MKKALKLSDIAVLLAGSCSGLISCSQHAQPTSTQLSKRLKQEEPLEPSEWALVKPFVSLAQQVQPQAMCYSPPMRDFKEFSGQGVVTLHCNKCDKTNLLRFDYAKDPANYCLSLKSYKKYTRLVGNLNAVARPLQLQFTLENQEFCRNCGKQNNKEPKMYLRCDYLDEQQRGSTRTELYEVAFPELIGFLQRASSDSKLKAQGSQPALDVTPEELNRSKQPLDKYQLELLRKILGLRR